jgi:hypothetical protein
LEGSDKNVVLLCEGCGERIVLGGPVWVWNCGSTSFACGCGALLTLSNQLDPPEWNSGSDHSTASVERKAGMMFGMHSG